MSVSWRLMERVLDLRLPDEQERVLVRMARFAADDGTNCYPGVKLLAEQAGRSERSVQRVLRALETAGLVVPVANMIGGRGRVAGYHVTLPAPVKGDTHDTLSGPETVTQVTPFAEETVSPAPPFHSERVTPMTPFTAERVSPVTEKGDTGDTSPSPPSTPLSPSGKDPEGINSTTPVESSSAAPDQAKILRSLSAEARAIVDWHRECHGSRRPVKLNPTSARKLEEAVADLGVDRLREAVEYMAGKLPPVRELSAAIGAAKTRRQADEQGVSPSEIAARRNGGQPNRRNGTHRAAPPADVTDADLAARMEQRARMTPEERLAAARQAKGLT